MTVLTFEHGARLVAHQSQHESSDSKESLLVDVSQLAHQYLFEELELASDLTLADVFGLLEKDPVLVSVYRRDFAEELLAHALKGPVLPQDEDDNERLEYLELYKVVEVNTAEQVLESSNRYDLHGVSFEFKEDTDMGGYIQAKGTRLGYGVSFTDLRELLALPLKVKKEVLVCEGDIYSRNFGARLQELKRERITLGQLLNSVLWELSFHGAPEEQQATARAIKQDVAELKEAFEAGTADSLLSNEPCIFEAMDRAGVQALFESTGQLSAIDITHALHGIADDVNAAQGLAEVLGERFAGIVIRGPYLGLNARDFRKALFTFTVTR